VLVGAETDTCNVRLNTLAAPAAIVPAVQDTTRPLNAQPEPPVPLTNAAPLGRVAETMTPVAANGPASDTVRL